MASDGILKEHIQHLLSKDCIYSRRITNLFNVKITEDNIQDLETLINLLEIHEESLKDTRKVLQLKQRAYLIKYFAQVIRGECE